MAMITLNNVVIDFGQVSDKAVIKAQLAGFNPPTSADPTVDYSVTLIITDNRTGVATQVGPSKPDTVR